MVYKVKVNKSGSKIAVFQDGVQKQIVEASSSTFSPFEAREFARGVYKRLVASQMVDTGAVPSVTTIQEEKQEVINRVENAKPVGSNDVAKFVPSAQFQAVASENETLKAKLAKVETDRLIERKARRGLAIAKEEVTQGKLEKNEKAIEARVASIVTLSMDEIEMLERRTAGQKPFASVDQAVKYASKLRVQARQLQAKADELVKADDTDAAAEKEKEAHSLFSKADEALKFAADDLEEKTTEDSIDSMSDAENPAIVESKLSSLASAYKRVASIQQKIAEEAKDAGEDEVAEAAKEEAKDAEKKAHVLLTAGEEEPDGDEKGEIEIEVESKKDKLAFAYKTIAKIQASIARQAEAEGETEVADAAESESKEAADKAKIISGEAEEDKEAELEDKEALKKDKKAEKEECAEGEIEEKEALKKDKKAEKEEIADDEVEEKEALKKDKKAEKEECAEAEEKEAAKDKKAEEDKEADDLEDKEATSLYAQLTSAYTRIATLQRKIAEKAEEAGETEVADAAESEAKEAADKAQTLKDAGEEVEDKKEASEDDKIEEKEASNDEEKQAEEVEEKEAGMSDEDLLFMATDITANDEEEEKEAKVAGEEEVKEAEEDEKKEAASDNVKKIASVKKHSEGISKIAKIEQNPFAGQTMVEGFDLESLWKKQY